MRTSAAFAVKRDGGRALAQKCLGEGLALPNDAGAFAIFRDSREGLRIPPLRAGRCGRRDCTRS